MVINNMGVCKVETIEKINDTTLYVTICNKDKCISIDTPNDSILRLGLEVVPKSCKKISYFRKPLKNEL